MRPALFPFLKRAGSWLVAVALMGAPAMAIDGDEMFADPVRETRAREIGRELRCMVCQNQSIFDSNSGLAKDLRVLVRTRMEAGDTDAEILDYISGRYGEYVLLKPRFSVQNAVLWGAPAGALALGLVLAAGYVRTRRKPVEEVPLSEAERASAQELLKEGRR